MERRVVITGFGLVTPLGLTIDTVWEKLCRGVSGVDRITRFDATAYPAQIAGEVRDFVPEHYIEKRELRRIDRFAQFAVAASQEAIQHAGLSITESNAERVGVYIGTAFGGLESLEAVHTTLMEKGPNRVSPLFPAMVAAAWSWGIWPLDMCPYGVVRQGPITAVSRPAPLGLIR